MKIQTKDGEASPFPASDLQENTKEVKHLAYGLYCMCGIFLLFFVYILLMTVYIVHNNVVNNIVGACL